VQGNTKNAKGFTYGVLTLLLFKTLDLRVVQGNRAFSKARTCRTQLPKSTG